MNRKFNSEIYESAFNALIDNGVPEVEAEKAAVVIGFDDANLPDLGRSDEDRQDIAVAMKLYWANQKDEK
ncbi:MAG: hypothetical protein AAF349_00345 [Cyanobacteria bacterium P01_A01_bin.68]